MSMQWMLTPTPKKCPNEKNKEDEEQKKTKNGVREPISMAQNNAQEDKRERWEVGRTVRHGRHLGRVPF